MLLPMSSIERRGSGAPWESVAGYSRVVRAGDRVLVAGTTATTEDGAIAGPAMPACRRGRRSRTSSARWPGRRDAGRRGAHAHVRDDIARWEDIGRAHGEGFGEHPPVTSMVQVAALIDPRMLVEIEAEAVLATS